MLKVAPFVSAGGGGARPQNLRSVDGDGVEGGGVYLKYLLIQYIAGKGH